MPMSPGDCQPQAGHPLARAAPEPCLSRCPWGHAAARAAGEVGSAVPLRMGTRRPRGPGSGGRLLSLLLSSAQRFHCVSSGSFSNSLFLPGSQCLCSHASRSSPPQEPGPPRPPLPKSYVPLESPPTVPPLPGESRLWPYPTSPSWQQGGEAKRGQVPKTLQSSPAAAAPSSSSPRHQLPGAGMSRATGLPTLCPATGTAWRWRLARGQQRVAGTCPLHGE